MNKFRLFPLVAGLLLCMASVSPLLAATDYSNWTVNLSGDLNTATGYYDYEIPQVAVSGQYVHIVWLATGNGDLPYKLLYRRSADGGKTFGAVQDLATDVSYWSFQSKNQSLAADGANLHVVYVSTSSVFRYLRSTDNGTTFEAVRDIGTIQNNGYAGTSGIILKAQAGRVVVAWSSNSVDSPYNKNLFCSYSNDAGATFNTTNLAHSDGGSSSPFFSVSAADMVVSGTNVYILYVIGDENWYTSQGHLYLAGSTDGGANFTPSVRVNLPSTDARYYATTIQDVLYTPNLAASGNNVYVTWVNFEQNNFDGGGSTFTLRFRRSTDNGQTLESPITLTPEPQTSDTLAAGQETIAASGNNVYVATSFRGSAGTVFWRSTDGGGSFAPETKISDGGWWPRIVIDPSVASGSRLYVVNGGLAKSTDTGATFRGKLSIVPEIMCGWNYPLLVAGNDGVLHYVAQGKYDCGNDFDTFYRRIAPQPAPGAAMKTLSLTTYGGAHRRDNMQVAASADINLTSAMTIEYWIKMDMLGDFNNRYCFQYEVVKRRASGQGSFELGYWNEFTGFYSRLVTENAANQFYGDFLASDYVPVDLGWYHVAMSYDANGGAENWKLYVNGELLNSATITTGNIVMDSMPLVLGAYNSGYNGTMRFANFRIWNRARSAAEIAADINRQLTGTEAGLVAYYTFAGTARDVTGRGNDGLFMYKESFSSLVSGSCGSAHGQSFTAAPVGNLCSAGSPSDVTGSGPWNWSCAVNDGPSGICSAGVKALPPASLAVPAADTDGNYAVSWGASATPGTGYLLQEATNSTFTTGLRTAYSGMSTTANITGRHQNATYYYRVRATKSGYAASDWRTSANGCAVPGNSAVGLPTSLTVPAADADGAYTVSWGASATTGATYELQEATNSTYSTGLRTVYTGTTLTAGITGRGQNVTYHYRVRAMKPGFKDSGYRKVNNSCAVPGAATAGTPASLTLPAADTDGTYTVSWGASATAGVTYELQEATNSAFTTGLRLAYSGSALTTNVAGRAQNTTYYYRVRAVKGGLKDSSYRGSYSCAVPGTATAGIPASLTVPAADTDGIYTINWGASATTGVTYELTEATNSAFTTGVRRAYTGTARTANITGRTAGTTNWYRVRAVKAGLKDSGYRTGINGCAVGP